MILYSKPFVLKIYNIKIYHIFYSFLESCTAMTKVHTMCIKLVLIIIFFVQEWKIILLLSPFLHIFSFALLMIYSLFKKESTSNKETFFFAKSMILKKLHLKVFAIRQCCFTSICWAKYVDNDVIFIFRTNIAFRCNNWYTIFCTTENWLEGREKRKK